MRGELAAQGTQLAFVYIGTEEQAADFFDSYNLADVPRVSGTEQRLYQAFELTRAKLTQLFSLDTFMRGFAALGKGHGIGRITGNAFQMPGVFLIKDGRIANSFRHATVADTPDYVALATNGKT